ncbi:MAG: MarR family transcriptional regulator [Desulfosarcina sp.]|nr:MarR family transcriptional regulator [Desulfosarcina sp.]MBC2744167.1 MarR family transcriptional regulator [Desulfosarcina sp.]MBC2767076.1 MarR family transcriptional regulator [Desulfosarcina sp.]
MLNGISRQDLDDILFGALQAIYRFERVKVQRFGLTYEQIYLLQFLRRQGSAAMSDIAAEMRIPVSTATRLIDRMEKRQLLNRRQSHDDKRSRIVEIEASGENLVQAVEDHTFSRISTNLEKITDVDISGVIRTATNLNAILNVDTTEGEKGS